MESLLFDELSRIFPPGRTRQNHCENGFTFIACSRYRSAVGFDDLLRDGKAQPRAARVRRPGRIQPEKLFEDPFELLFRDGIAPIGKRDHGVVTLIERSDINDAVLVAVSDCVF